MSTLDELKTTIKEQLPDLDLVIGWKQGFDPLHASASFMKKPEDVDKLIVNPLCVQNLATYLPGLKDKRVGIVAKECDTRSIGELLQESLIDRDRIVVFSVKCPGAVDLVKVKDKVGEISRVREVDFSNGQVEIKTPDQTYNLELEEILPDKCLSLRYEEPVLADFRFDETGRETICREQGDADLKELESMSLEERFDYWKHHLDRCVRCYACLNACPMCVCRDQCIAATRDPHWLTQETDIRQKWMFQLIHAMHLSGRCTECGECERACPMDIPILSLRKRLNREIKELFDYTSGLDPEARPPLMTFEPEEANIKEREW